MRASGSFVAWKLEWIQAKPKQSSVPKHAVRARASSLVSGQHGERAMHLGATEPAESGRPGRIATHGKPESGPLPTLSQVQRRPARSDTTPSPNAAQARSDAAAHCTQRKAAESRRIRPLIERDQEKFSPARYPAPR